MIPDGRYLLHIRNHSMRTIETVTGTITNGIVELDDPSPFKANMTYSVSLGPRIVDEETVEEWTVSIPVHVEGSDSDEG